MAAAVGDARGEETEARSEAAAAAGRRRRREAAPSADEDEDDSPPAVHLEATGAVAGLLEEEAAAAGSVGAAEPGSELQPLLSQTQQPSLLEVDPVSAGFTLIMSVVGTGLLSLSSAFKCLGGAASVAALAAVAALMLFSADLMLRSHLGAVALASVVNGGGPGGPGGPGAAAAHANSHASAAALRGETYEALAAASVVALGGSAAQARWAKGLVNVVNAVGIFGGCCAYIAIGKDIFPVLVRRLGLDASHWLWSTEMLTLLCVSLVSLPLSLQRNIGSLRYTSIAGFCFSVYTVFLLAWRGAQAVAEGRQQWAPRAAMCPEAPLFSGLVDAVSVFNFSFVMHFNVLPLFKSLPRPRAGAGAGAGAEQVQLCDQQHEQQRASTMRKVLVATTASCWAIYAAVGSAGLALFGAKVQPNVLDNFAPEDDAVNVARAAITACCFLCLPLLEFPLRGTVLSLCRVRPTAFSRATATVLLMAAQFSFALLAPSIKIVFQVTGGSAIVGFCFCFPALFALALLKSHADPALRLSKMDLCLCTVLLVCMPCFGFWSVADGIRKSGSSAA
jgi:amino acid permease